VPDEKILLPDVINIGCTNVLKGLVDRAWQSASGYTITINPKTFKYKYVRKSRLQYRNHLGIKHDGKIFETRQEKDINYVYQRYINTKNKEGKFRTIRVPIFGDHIPCLVLKHSNDPFKEVRCKVEIVENIGEYITEQELGWLKIFNQIMGVDFAEIDMVRDINTKLIYAIDVNNIAGDGIYGKLKPSDVIRVKKMFAESFNRLL
jgi:hypothetical protein